MDVHIGKIDEAKSGDAIGFREHLATYATRTVAGFVIFGCRDMRIIERKRFQCLFRSSLLLHNR